MIRLEGQAKDLFLELPRTTSTDALPLTLTPLDRERHQCPLRIAQQAMFELTCLNSAYDYKVHLAPVMPNASAAPLEKLLQEMSGDLIHVPPQKVELWRLHPSAYDPRLVKMEIMAYRARAIALGLPTGKEAVKLLLGD